MNETKRIPFDTTTLVGGTLIIIGVLLLLSKLGIVMLSWRKILWVVGMIAGAFLAVRGILTDRRGKIFWGSLLFFVSLYYVLWVWWIVDHDRLLWLPSMSLAFGLSYLVLFLYDPSRLTLLIPSAWFIGAGVIGILWWWEYLEWFEMEDALRTYWPLALVAWGSALLLRRK